MSEDAPGEALRLTAYELYDAGTEEAALSLTAARARRAWMDATPGGFANRCLPLLMANAGGWWVITDRPIRATWDGGQGTGALRVEGLGASHFGGGVLTITLNWLFRTPPGWDLLVRGPANLPKRGAAALEGLVEADWNPATFTVNWQMTEPWREVVWEPGEPVAMLVPQRRGELEAFAPAAVPISSDPEARDAYEAWARDRGEFIASLQAGCPQAAAQGWQKDYVRGVLCPKRRLRGFECSG